MVTLDTNAVIYFLKKDASAEVVLKGLLEKAVVLYVPTVVELELFSLPTLTVQEALETDLFLRTVVLVPLNSELARLAGELRRNDHLKTPDSIIAATALFTNSTLLTRNTKDFKRIPELILQLV